MVFIFGCIKCLVFFFLPITVDCAGPSGSDSVRFCSPAGVCLGFLLQQAGAEKAHEEDLLQVFKEVSLNISCSRYLLYSSFRGGGTQTGLALKYILRKGFPGGRNSSSVPHIAILLSDGRSQGSVVQTASQLKETGMVLFAVGLRYPKYVCWRKTIISSKDYRTSHTEPL